MNRFDRNIGQYPVKKVCLDIGERPVKLYRGYVLYHSGNLNSTTTYLPIKDTRQNVVNNAFQGELSLTRPNLNKSDDLSQSITDQAIVSVNERILPTGLAVPYLMLLMPNYQDPKCKNILLEEEQNDLKLAGFEVLVNNALWYWETTTKNEDDVKYTTILAVTNPDHPLVIKAWEKEHNKNKQDNYFNISAHDWFRSYSSKEAKDLLRAYPDISLDPSIFD